VSCGVAEYRFGDGPAGLLADADKAMVRGQRSSPIRGGGSHVCYRNELSADSFPRVPAAV